MITVETIVDMFYSLPVLERIRGRYVSDDSRETFGSLMILRDGTGQYVFDPIKHTLLGLPVRWQRGLPLSIEVQDAIPR